MNELVQMVTQKTGISEDKARQAVDVVLQHLKSRLPGPIASHLNQFTGGGGGAESQASNMLGGMFGDKKAS